MKRIAILAASGLLISACTTMSDHEGAVHAGHDHNHKVSGEHTAIAHAGHMD
jgi:hypothetical protein